MPAADTFLFSSARHIQLVDLNGFNYCRLKVNKLTTAGAASSALELRYATTYSTTVGNYAQLGTSAVSVGINVQNQYLDTGWIEIAPDAKTDVFIAVVGSGGDGALDPAFGNISAAFC